MSASSLLSSIFSSEESEEKVESKPETLVAEEDALYKKNEYSEEDMLYLIERIKDFTTLPDLTDTSWAPSTFTVIQNFFEEPREEVLSIYFVDDVLEATLGFPKYPACDIMYFTKKPTDVITPENFHDVIQFGTINGPVEGTILNVIDNVFSPTFLAAENWPDGVKTEFYSTLHEYLGSITDIHYRMQGLTVLYMPFEGTDLSVEEACTDNELIKRLEGVVVNWSHQIRQAVADKGRDSSELHTPQDEYQFWIYRYENLASLEYQLSCSDVKQLTHILQMTQSTYIQEFDHLNNIIKNAMDEVKSNIQYLQVLNEPCSELQKAERPLDIPNHIPKILHFLRAIWLNSPYFNTEEKVSKMCRALSNQIIIQCSQFINLDVILEKTPHVGIDIIKECIDCCVKYKLLFQMMSEAHAENSEKVWKLDEVAIFNHVDSFCQRCSDLIEVCDEMITFGRLDEKDTLPRLHFLGTRGEKFDAVCDKVEEDFKKHLLDIKKVKNYILDVNSAVWFNVIVRFRNCIQELEMTILNLMDEVFETVQHVEEALHVLQTFYHYTRKESIKRRFEKKTADALKIFSDDIQEALTELVNEKDMYPASVPYYSGCALMATLKKKRLSRLMKLIDDAHWLGQNAIKEDLTAQYLKLSVTVNSRVTNLYHKWVDSVNEVVTSRLERPLMARSIVRPGLLECNLDCKILDICREATYWEVLEFDIPSNVIAVYKKWDNIKFVYENVLQVVMDYNRIISSMSDEERALFKELIKGCEKKINPGLVKLKWSTDVSDEYIAECAYHISELQSFIDDFKGVNVKVARICEKISDMSLIDIPEKIFHLNDLQKLIVSHCEKVLLDIIEKYKDIFNNISIILEGFIDHIKAMLKHWTKYVYKMDKLIEEGLRLCLKGSLQVMYEVLHDVKSVPLLHVKVSLQNNKITYSPDISEISNVISNIKATLLKIMVAIPRLQEQFRVGKSHKPYHVILNVDEECSSVQNLILKEVELMKKEINSYTESWEPFYPLWTVDKDVFIAQYKHMNPDVSSFDQNISGYVDMTGNVQQQESITQVSFLLLDATQLKQAMVEHCIEWQKRLCDLLVSMTDHKLNTFLNYMHHNAKRVHVVPQTLEEMRETYKVHESLIQELPVQEEQFPLIHDRFAVLEKYNVTLPPKLEKNYTELDERWHMYLKSLDEAKIMLDIKKESFRNNLMESAEELKKNAAFMLEDFRLNGPFSSDWKAEDALKYLAEMREMLTDRMNEEEKLREYLATFGISMPSSTDLRQLMDDLTAAEAVWGVVYEWDKAWELYKTGGFKTVETLEMEQTAQSLFRKLTRFSRELHDKQWEIIEYTRKKVDAFRRTLPLIGDLKNPAMKPRHWERVKVAIDRDFDEESPEFNLDAIVEMNMQAYAEEINIISNAATMEEQIEKGIEHIEDVWKAVTLEMTPLKEKGMYRLVAVEDVFQTLEDNLVELSAMKSTRFVEPFADKVEYWEKTLSTIAEVLDIMLQVQKQYLYLDNVFVGENIRKQLPKETDMFNKLMIEWKDITSGMHKDKIALEATRRANLFQRLKDMNDVLELIMRALEEFLETKRYIFPRFYFISNDDLLEILAQSKKPENVQPHLKKCFDNINKLKIVKGQISHKWEGVGMFSADTEYIEFTNPVILDGPVELWLCQVESMMRVTLKDQLRKCRTELRRFIAKRDKWIKEWPGQMCITASQIQWTTNCTRALMHCKILEAKKPLKKLRHKQNQVLNIFSEAIRGTLTSLQRAKIVALVTIEIHARDVIDKMYKTNCMDVTAFEWLSQLRFYWDRDIDDCIIRQTNTYFVYGYEYLGNSGRLVITPLTDRCYITLTTALHLHRGGSPKGPAGTGKTETTKDLGKNLGNYVIVINCSEGLDYRSMGRMFSGLAQTGAWGCFDEFNRINIEVLSVVAQQILSILNALQANMKRFTFEGSEIKLVHSCGIFITMNPGYAGRTELPDNLKSMFRPISMVVPDMTMIAEITLFGEGFRETRLLAKKVYTLYSLAVQQLSKQDHYDFGLRAMITLLRYAGRKRRSFPHLPDDEVILLAMKDSNDAKLTADDLPLFTAITSDLFPGIELPVVDYKMFTEAIEAEFRQHGLQPIPKSVTRVIQLYETKCSRHSVMIVGKTGSGKSVTWNMLKQAVTRLAKEGKEGYNTVEEYPINPKALSLGELYGEYNLATNEWLDGVLSAIMRTTCADESPDEKWILFDGPVDAVWIENMNSVMDDNKVLTLINSERITMPSQVSLVFEVEDLAVASPATVSRCGMVYNDYTDLGWRPYVKSWLQKHDIPEVAAEMEKHFELYVEQVLNFKHLNCKEVVSVSEMCAITGLCKLLTCLATKENGLNPRSEDKETFRSLCKMWFLFCMIWSVCATVDEDGRKKMDNFIREIEGVFPLKDSVYEYFVDPASCTFMSWESKLLTTWKFDKELPFFKIIVPTVDTVRYNYVVSNLLQHNSPSLLVGPVGTGKTSTAYSVIDSLDREKYSILIVNMSSQTTSNNVQDIIESRVEKRTRELFVPPGGKKLITFFDDLNMPAKEIYGAQPPLELLRQWIDYGFWYDRQKQTRKYVERMLLMAAMGPPGGARQVITGRLLSCFNVINMTFPSESQITRIFGTMLAQQLSDFEEEMKLLTSKITTATVELYNEVCAKMLPTPLKMHYLFNLRDISKVFQGLLRSHKDYQSSNAAFLKLWLHECFCVFSDRLVDEKDDEWFLNQITEKLAYHFQITFHNLCPDKEPPIFTHFINPYRVYEDVKIDVVRTQLLKQLQEYNNSPGTVRMDLVLFKDAVRHICRIVRVISQPRGNMLLVGIGGSGRQSLSRLSGYICEYDTFQLEMTKVYRLQEFRDDLKNLYRLTGVENRETMFLFSDTQIADESFLEIINNMLSSGEVPNLYKPEEFEEVRKQLLDIALKADIQPTNEAIFGLLLDRVRTNLHIVVCMSPIGSEFRDRIRQYPALVNCTTIDWFREWPKEALLEVASRYLTDVNFLETITVTAEPKGTDVEREIEQERLHEAVAETFATIHSSVTSCSKRMWEEMKRPNYVTPTNYLELVAGFKVMLQEKRESLAASANKLRGGLSKIDESREKIEVMSADLEIAQAEVKKIQQECAESMAIIKTHKQQADDQQKTVELRRERIAEEGINCKRLADVAQADLDEAMPILNAAIKALDALSKKDLGEIRTYARPPPKVLIVLEAVMILKGSEPTWNEAKRQLGDINFIKSLKELDKDNITDRTMKKINNYTSSEDFDPEKVGAVSFAAKSLCMWVIAMEKYCKVYRIVAPKQAKVDEAMSLLQEKQKELQVLEEKLVELSLTLEKLEKELEEKTKHEEELNRKAEELRLKLERATLLVSGLADEKVRWGETVKTLDAQFELLPGDCLLATAYVSYAGPFVSEYRDELVRMWIGKVKEVEVPHSYDFKVVTFLCDPTVIREWNIQGLPSDEFSTENGIIVTRGTRWPLLIDPQCQGMKWLKNMEAKRDLKVIDLAEPEFMKTVEVAVQFGKPVLLQNILETIDPALTPILNKAVVIHGGQSVIKLGDKMVQYHPDFRFFISTKLGNPHYPPEISTKTTLVNFAVKEQGLEAQLLGTVVRKERPQLEEQKDSLVMAIAKNKRALKDFEDKLLKLLTEAKGSLIDDIELLNVLQMAKTAAVSIIEQLKNAETTELEIDIAREGYRPCAKRASILFFVLNDMARIDPMYQFSLDAYISLFTISIDKSQRSHILEERINFLNDYHTYAVYRNTCRGLFEHHKLLFSFHMCMKILDGEGKVSLAEYSFLLQGGIVLDRENQMDNPCSAWLPAEAWDNVTELDKISGFHGIIATFEQFPKDWHIWYISKEPETMPLPGEWEEICTEFQRMLFIRCLRQDRIPFCISTFVVNTLGQRFVEPPILDVKAVVGDSTPQTPLIFVLSPGVDPASSLVTLAESMHMTDRFESLSLGQGQSPIATEMIKTGIKEGQWVFLANCHLSLSWMPDLNKIVEQLQLTNVHPDFRLWLSSSPHPEFPIAILQAGIKMTTEPPKGIKANLKRLYQLISEEKFSLCRAQPKYKKLLFSLCFFHAVLLERKKFQQLGWNVVYSFNDSDFEVSENLLSIYLDEYPDTPWDALKYLIAGINYGGHVTDDWDRRLLTTYINGYFNEDALNISMYKLSALQTYFIPRDGSLQSYKDYISFLPTVDQPEAFGQHSNADIMSLISDTRMMFETLMSLQHRATVETGVSKEDKVLQLAADVLDRLPKTIDYENTEKLIGPEKSPLQVVLLQEILRYNELLVEIHSSLHSLQRGVRGLVVMSSYLEEVFTCIFEGRVPPQWLKAYPSMKALGSWTRDLILRMEHFSHWALTLHQPVLFWLAAYTFPTGFLTAVLQTSARASNISIDSLSWEFIIVNFEEYLLVEPPSDGVYIKGLFLEGAGWDKRHLHLTEPLPMELVCPMPIIHFKPAEHLKKKTRGIYICPTYYYPQRCGTQGRSAYVVAVDLKSGTEPPDHWIKRGTALLLSLAN